ncbi:hypothetical protein SAMN05421881_100261 [Nitrosomonas halophila]|uniref:Uncharacterized protein n=1 Tax=Nitrosomonas halophila TaxID=44576 RepID=A0A1H3C4H5_9PROT|nr:hypothetical protein SAMN05421881_100261 [Nitrosomonas halophila]
MIEKSRSASFALATIAILGQPPSQRRQIETPVRPVAGLPDIFVIAAIHAEIMARNLRTRKLFAARLSPPPRNGCAFAYPPNNTALVLDIANFCLFHLCFLP